ncbi:hypothetical protein CAEBREN_18121 [Caenorhabditis brenneri]|uniref:Uncharacterized protein n=1 Tax=Caenorhabditis brenneri TaxID=135651 RepID=G0P076_CAEBE|nr:hypothetical protein CAEBREN_18121 [Caenorhabditis brenneri]
MFKYVLVVLLLIAVFQYATADWECDVTEKICKSIVCHNCKIAECVNGKCVCSLCD